MLESAEILVVDDEKMIREGCARLLEKIGHKVTLACDGIEALDLIRQKNFDIMLLDIKMPRLDGMGVMGVLKREQLDLLVLVITGFATIETAVQAMKAGAYDLLIKPFSTDSLRIAVARAVEHISLAREAEDLRRLQARSLKDIESEQSRLRTVMNAMACGVLVTDNEKTVVLCNPLVPRLLNMSTPDIVGRSAAHIIPQQPLVDMIDRVFAEEEAITALEQELPVTGSLWLRTRTAPVRDNEARIIGSVTVLQDITHTKEMEQMKNQFVAMVSHELKTPLAVIMQQVEVLLGGMAGAINDRQAHFLERARIRGQELIDLINQLLDLSRIEAGQIVSQQEPLDLVPVIRRVCDFLKPQADIKQQDLVWELPECLPQISADPGNMDEVFMNVINNAIKYTPEGGRIEVRAEREGDYVRFRIADSGFGIPKDDIPRIFDKFYRVKTDKTISITGSGLGLPIVKGIVEAHLGEIEIQSRPGQGTIFDILLPIIMEKTEENARPPSQ